MVSFTRPSDAAAAAYLAARRGAGYSYPAQLVGATRDRLPPGYAIAHYRVPLGTGERVFQRAKIAIADWKMFPQDLVELYPARPCLAVGTDVALRIRTACLWWLASCRIVYTVDETPGADAHSVYRFGFAYGSLPGHAEQGEERFLVEWNPVDDRVTYDLLAFSRPDAPLVWLGLPFARFYERRFGWQSCQSMVDDTRTLK